jgi:hypothetical protein
MFRINKKRISAIIGTAAAAAILTVAGTAGQAVAYNGNQAANYADTWATSRNTNFPVFGNDCTNFVSQSVNHGGFSVVNFGQAPSSSNSWWLKWVPAGGFTWSLSWPVTANYYNFLIADSPGGIGEGISPGNTAVNYTPNSVVTGDVLFYDWGQGEGLSHATIQVGIGTDPGSGWYGNYVDEHTNDRYHMFWSGWPYNANAATTTIYFMHIDSRNN